MEYKVEDVYRTSLKALESHLNVLHAEGCAIVNVSVLKTDPLVHAVIVYLEEGELVDNSVVKEFLKTATDGENYVKA